MTNTAASFIAKATIKAADIEHRRKINFNIDKYNASVPYGKQQFADISMARDLWPLTDPSAHLSPLQGGVQTHLLRDLGFRILG